MKYKELREQFLTTEAETSNREIAIKWWNSLSLDNQYAHTKVYYPKRQLSSLTGREIEEMFTATEPTKTRNQTPPQSAEEWIKINDIDLDMLHYIDSLGDKQLDADLLYDMMNEFAQTTKAQNEPAPKLGAGEDEKPIGFIKASKYLSDPDETRKEIYDILYDENIDSETQLKKIQLITEQYAQRQDDGWVSLEDIYFLLKFVPEWAKNVPKGLGETFYGTLSYEGDLKVKERLDQIISKLPEPPKSNQ